MAVLGGEDLDLYVDAVEEVSGTRVQDLVTNVDILVFEEACLGVKLRA